MSTSTAPDDSQPFRFVAGDRVTGKRLRPLLEKLPEFQGRLIAVRTEPVLRAHRGRLRTRGVEGIAVHAASSIRGRQILLERSLTGQPKELERIFVHEIFHFVWVRLSNQRRRSFESLVSAEFERGARGELGWSAESRKASATGDDRRSRTRRWREYVCESFCDTAAWWFTFAVDHPESTLAKRHQQSRRRWFRNFLRPGERIRI